MCFRHRAFACSSHFRKKKRTATKRTVDEDVDLSLSLDAEELVGEDSEGEVAADSLDELVPLMYKGGGDGDSVS